MRGDGVDLQLEGQSSNPQVLSWLLFKKNDRMQEVQVSGRLKTDAAIVSIHDLTATAKTVDGVKLQINGNAVVHPQAYRLTQADAGLAVKFSAPTLASANLFDSEAVPKLGPVSGSLKLALGRDVVAIYNADIELGERKSSHILLKGDVGYVQLFKDLVLPELNLQTEIQTKELAQLGKQLKYKLPALGPATLRGKLVTKGSELQLQGANLEIGAAEQSLRAVGMFATQLRDPTNYKVAVDVDIQASELTRLAEPFGYTVPQLGETHITGWLDASKSDLHIKDGLLVVGATGQPTMRADFNVTTEMQKGSTINTKFDVAASSLIAAFSEMQPKNLGRLQGNTKISHIDGKWSIESISMASSQTGLYQLNLDGSNVELQKFDEANIKASLVIDSPPKLGELLGVDLSGVGPFRQQGLLSMKQGRLHFDGKTSLGATHSTVEINGQFKDGKPVLSGSLEVPVMHLADFGLGASPASVSSTPDKDKPSKRHVFSREKLNIAFLNDFDFDFTVSINKVESKEVSIDSISGRFQLHDGKLSVKPMQLIFEGGNTNINFEIKSGEVPHYQLSMIADDLRLELLMAQVQKEVPIQGYSNIHLDLRAQGHSPHEIASSLSGNINLGLENARIPKHIVDKLSIDVFNWVLHKSPTSDKYTDLNCLIMIFAADQGELKSNTIIADGPHLSIGGRIDMDLGEETLDIVLIPKQKKKLWSSVAPVKVHGPMLDPKVSALPVKAALKQVGTVTMLSTGIILPVYAAEKLWSFLDGKDKQSGGCDTVNKLLEAEKNKARAKEVK